MYWLSARTRNDLFLLYCFADSGVPTPRLRESIAERVLRIPDLLVRVQNAPANLAYPFWEDCVFAEDQFVEHEIASAKWSAVTAALGDLVDTGLDAAHRPWRLHVFRGVADAPLAQGEQSLVAVLQISHALADGRRAADIARALFAESESDRAIVQSPKGSAPFSRLSRWIGISTEVSGIPLGMGRTMIRGVAAFRAQRALADLTAAGELAPPGPGYPPNLLNGNGNAPEHSVRMIVRAADETRAPGHTVTVVVLTAVSVALRRYLIDCGENPEALGAQVPMAISDPAGGQRNSYRDLSVDLAVTEPDLRLRAERIAADLAARRTRALHPLHAAQDRVTAAIPAPILHRDVTGYPIDVLPESVSGHTVVSSVHRGPADLSFGGGRVRFTAGFPALGAVMHLTHGVHGLGDTVTISVHADPKVVRDVDAYAAQLDAALDEVVAALS